MSPEEYIKYLKRKEKILGDVIIRLNEITKQMDDVLEQLRKEDGKA